MVFEAHGMSFPCTELLLFNYAKVNTVFHSMAPLIIIILTIQIVIVTHKDTTVISIFIMTSQNCRIVICNCILPTLRLVEPGVLNAKTACHTFTSNKRNFNR